MIATDRAALDVPPQSLEAERAVLGAMLLDSACIERVAAVVSSGDFYRANHATIFGLMLELRDRGEPVDKLVLIGALKDRGLLDAVGGVVEVDALTNVVPTTANAEHYAKRVRDAARARATLDALAEATKIIRESGDSVPEKIERAQRIVAEATSSCDSSSRGREPDLISLGSVAPQAVEFLWRPFLPVGKLTLLEGDPSAGKTWVALAIAAVVTRGLSFEIADGVARAPASAASVIYLTAEDGLGDTLVPRLQAVGADLSRVHALAGWKLEERGKKRTGPVSLVDVDVLERALVRVKPALVVIDPLQAFLGPDVDMHRANEVRPLLSGLVKLAEKHACAILAIRHLAKAGGSRAIYRGMGSIDFTAAARSVLMAGQDPTTKARAIVHLKSSLAPAGPSIGYALGEDGFEWTGISTLTAADLNAPELPPSDTKRTGAQEWLLEFLSNGWRPSQEVYAAGGRAPGKFSQRTLERARKELENEVVATKRGATWGWVLASHTATNTSGGGLGGLESTHEEVSIDPRQTTPPSGGGLGGLDDKEGRHTATPLAVCFGGEEAKGEKGMNDPRQHRQSSALPRARARVRDGNLVPNQTALAGFVLDPETDDPTSTEDPDH